MTKKRILDDISSGQWTFDVTAPEVINSLCKCANQELSSVEKSSLTFLSANRYLSIKLDVSDPLVSKEHGFSTITADRNTEPWRRLISTVFPSSKLASDKRNLIQESIDYLLEVNPTLYSCIPKWVNHFVFLSDAPWLGASSPHSIGTIYWGEKIHTSNSLRIVESLVHESGHQELFLINFYDRLVNSKSDYRMVHSPLQGKLRPPIGRLHSLFAIFRMHQLQRNTNLAIELKKKFNDTLSTFEANELTEFADTLVRRLQDQVNA